MFVLEFRTQTNICVFCRKKHLQCLTQLKMLVLPCKVDKSVMFFFDILFHYYWSVDVRMPYFTEFLVQSFFLCLSQIFVVCIVYPLFVFIALGIIGIFIFFDIYMNKGVIGKSIFSSKITTRGQPLLWSQLIFSILIKRF